MRCPSDPTDENMDPHRAAGGGRLAHVAEGFPALADGLLAAPAFRMTATRRPTTGSGRGSSIPGMSGWMALALFAAMLSACGGGGGASPPPESQPVQEAPPEPAPEEQPEQPEPEPAPQPAPEEPPEPDPDPDPQLMLEDLQPAPPDPQPAPPDPQPAPEEPPTPDPQPVSTTTGPAPVAPVRAHATQSVHSTPVSHPLGQTSTVYRAETLEPATAPRTAGSWETVEYNLQRGLGLIRASTGYAARTTGRPGGGGVTIAIVGRRIPVDDGESIGHYDLEGVTQARIFTSHPPAPDLDHETVVAGAAAARRNGLGAHGVAYNANIVSVPQSSAPTRSRLVLGWDIEAILASTAGLSRSYYSLFGGNFRSNPAASAHVANLSLFVSIGFSQPALRGMQHMAQAGRVMVAALGNDGKPNPSFPPATLVGREGVAGHAIAVGALNWHGTGADTFAWSSTRCGKVKRWCIFAPGAGIYTTFGQYSNRARRDHAYASGTSVAAPHVAGAVAAVWAAFPNKTGAQIVQRILDTARQVDTANGNYDSDGISPIYGHGALDLGAAMNPVGFTSLLTRGSGAVPVRRSFVSLPPGFRHRPTAALRDAIVYDTQTFPFLHDLNGAVLMHRAQASAVDDFLQPPRYRWSSQRLGRGIRLGFASSRPERGAREPDMRPEKIRDWRFRVAAAPSLSLRFARGFGARGASHDFVARRLGRGLFRDRFVVEPIAGLAGDGMALGVDWRRDEHTRLDFVAKAGSGYFGGGRARLASLGASRRFGAALALSARYGALRERGSLLGIRGSGAFRDASGAHTDFLDLGVERRTASGAVLFGSAGLGLTKSEAAGSGALTSGWSGGRSEAFAFGGEWSDLWRDSDRLTLSASSPFRPRGAGVYVDVPDRELADGVVGYTRHRVNLSPRGREVRLQAVYEAETAPGVAATLGGFLRLNPDHDPEAAPEFGAAARLRMDF